MKLVLRPGVKPPKRVVVPTREQIRLSNPLTDLCLELREGEEVTYTIRDVKETCRIEAAVRNMQKTDSTLQITMENLQGERKEHTVIIAEGDTKTYELGIVCTGCEWKIKTYLQQGNVQVDEIIFQN